MEQIRVLLINPNPRSMSLIQPVVALFYSLLQRAGIDMHFFDTTFYDVSDRYVNTDKFKQSIMGVRKFDDKLKPYEVPIKSRQQMLDDFRSEMETYQPDVLLASAMEGTIEFTRELLAHVRDLGVPHVLGGVFATYASETAIAYDEVDYICVGDAENTLVPIVQKIATGQSPKGIPGLWIKGIQGVDRNPVDTLVELETAPRFDASIFEDSRFYRAMAGNIYRMFPVETHRGCPQACTFCNSPVQNEMYKETNNERYFRKKPVYKIMEDIKYFVDDMNAEYFFFWADNFLAYSLRDIEEFCEAYSDYKIPFYAQSYPATLNEKKIKLLKEVGLDRVGMGVEHGNEDYRKNVIKRVYSNEKAIRQVKILRDHGVEYSCNNIVGFPDETPELHWDTVLLNRALQPDTASCSIFTPFHGTAMRRTCVEKGYIDDPDVIAPTNSEASILNMPQFPPDQILGKSRTFNLYRTFPENRFKDISRAEEITPEGDRIWEELKQEYQEVYASAPITSVPEPGSTISSLVDA